MSIVSIDNARVVPVSEDLTADDLTLQILRGLEKMHRVDKKLASTGVSLTLGEWGVVGDDGTVTRPTTTPQKNSYLCFAGTDRFDSHATGQVTLIMSSKVIAQSNMYDQTATYHAGNLLVAKDLGGGEAKLALAVSDADKAAAVAMVTEVGTGYLTYEVL